MVTNGSLLGLTLRALLGVGLSASSAETGLAGENPKLVLAVNEERDESIRRLMVYSDGSILLQDGRDAELGLGWARSQLDPRAVDLLGKVTRTEFATPQSGSSAAYVAPGLPRGVLGYRICVVRDHALPARIDILGEARSPDQRNAPSALTEVLAYLQAARQRSVHWRPNWIYVLMTPELPGFIGQPLQFPPEVLAETSRVAESVARIPGRYEPLITARVSESQRSGRPIAVLGRNYRVTGLSAAVPGEQACAETSEDRTVLPAELEPELRR